jgi:hypothetical protein
MSDACPRCVEMHRRAQRAESRAIRAEGRVLERYALNLLADIHYRRRAAEKKAHYWKSAYYDAVRKIRDSGLVSTRSSRFPDRAHYVEGDITVLLDRLIAAVRPSWWQRTFGGVQRTPQATNVASKKEE